VTIELRAGMYLKRNGNFSLLSKVYEEIKDDNMFKVYFTCFWTIALLSFHPRK
jgi:hypothetical protein